MTWFGRVRNERHVAAAAAAVSAGVGREAYRGGECRVVSCFGWQVWEELSMLYKYKIKNDFMLSESCSAEAGLWGCGAAVGDSGEE